MRQGRLSLPFLLHDNGAALYASLELPTKPGEAGVQNLISPVRGT